MKHQQSYIERKILAVFHDGFPKSENPGKDMAERVGIKTEALLAVLGNWKREGKLSRIGAIVDHFKVGLSVGQWLYGRSRKVVLKKLARN